MIANDSLTDIVEDYISEKRDGRRPSEATLKSRLKRFIKNDDQIHEIIIEIDDDCDKELLAGSGAKKSKKGLTLSIIVFLGLCLITILSGLGFLFKGNLFVFFYGGIATSFLYGSKCYYEIIGVKQRMKRRELKWKNWH